MPSLEKLKEKYEKRAWWVSPLADLATVIPMFIGILGVIIVFAKNVLFPEQSTLQPTSPPPIPTPTPTLVPPSVNQPTVELHTGEPSSSLIVAITLVFTVFIIVRLLYDGFLSSEAKGNSRDLIRNFFLSIISACFYLWLVLEQIPV
jgi:hypothetical protein